MNDRIKQLAEQAGSTHKANLGVYQFYAHELQQFASLIISECAEVSRQHLLDKADRSYLVHEKVKQHFGVE